MDSYAPIYNAVRDQIRGCDPAQIIRDNCHMDASFAIESVRNEFLAAAWQMMRSSAIYRPAISIDGDKWIALYGDNLQDGVAGCGDSPTEAMDDFDRAWNAKLSQRQRVNTLLVR